LIQIRASRVRSLSRFRRLRPTATLPARWTILSAGIAGSTGTTLPATAWILWANLIHRDFSVAIFVERLQRLARIGDFSFINDAVVICIQRVDQWRNRTLTFRRLTAGLLTIAGTLARRWTLTIARAAVFALLQSRAARLAGLIGVLRREVCRRQCERQRHQETCGVCFHVCSFLLLPSHNALASPIRDSAHVKAVCRRRSFFVKEL
jgi:hypothetical protein